MHERFLDLEETLELFDKAIDGAPLWDYMRTTVRDYVVEALEFFDEKHSPVDRSLQGYLRETRSIIDSLVRSNPYRCKPTDLLFIGHQRRKLEADGTWWDPYCDPLIEALANAEDCDTLVLERPFHNRHQRPARTEKLAYLDMLSLKATLAMKRRPFKLSAEDRRYLGEIEQAFEAEFGIAIPIAQMTEARLAVRRAQLPQWQKLFAKLDPKLLFLVVSYGNEIPIEAAQTLGIPTVEIQHGVVSKFHLGYSYERPTAKKRLFPDYMLLFGEFWRNAAHYPLPQERLFSTGYPYFEERRQATRPQKQKRQLLVLSQRSIGIQLSRIAAELARHPQVDHEIVYKLHPGELATWREDYPWLLDAPLSIKDDSEEPLYDLFEQSTAQLGSYSTALYEGLAFGLKTLIETLPGSESMDHLVASTPSVVRTEGIEEIVAALNNLSSYPSAAIDAVFRPGATANAKAAIATILRQTEGKRRR